MEETTGLSKQQKKSMETKEKIFKAAKRILQRSGYETLSIKIYVKRPVCPTAAFITISKQG